MRKPTIWSGFPTFSRAERRALFVFFLGVFLLRLIPFFLKTDSYPYYTEADWAAFRAEIDTTHGKLPAESKSVRHSPRQSHPPVSIPLFDPNTVSSNQLQAWNVPERIIRTWMNYRNAGGHFRQADDLRRIYGLSDQWAKRLIPSVRINNPESKAADTTTTVAQATYSSPGEDTDTQQVAKTHPVARVEPVDINQSQEEDWLQLPGIGPTYAGRILRFREALGGFASVDQVGDTWHLPDSVFQRIKSHLTSSEPFRRLAINELSQEELAAHPYLDHRQATVIVRYRSHYGPITGREMLQKTGVLREEEINRLLAYLSF